MSNCVFLFSVSVNLCLLCSAVGVVRSPAMTTVEGRERGFVNLNDMFHEVEELMEDTQHILEDAVDQITAESAKSLENHHSHHSDKIVKAITIHTDKRMNNTAGEPSHIHAAISDERNSVYHECVVDEDCGELKYCLYGIDTSKCLPCIPTDMPCRKNEECCSSQMCVWGQCTVNATEGTEGMICQGQNDCKLDLCCAFQRELLFPVCNPKPRKGEACLNQPNLLMDMLAWDQGVPRDYCPCTNDLECQSHGRGSVCGE
ncbi:dickkopf-related protein 3-like [Syngnathoides biaculeatus]|uniref:dickkopf-related protein 3-like n=1 Tax=Syngnathoides biaculeatus TaxID=300417 RepID=UPI002ADE4377|nr:dickkopf-related protein 3-like [Syngnathoides biaculeatus]